MSHGAPAMNGRIAFLSRIFLVACFISAAEAAPSLSNKGPIDNPLSQRELANLHTFARLYGYVRFFEPSDQADRADWDAVAIAGVQKVRTARNTPELIGDLRDIFQPLSPTLRIYPTGSKAPAESLWLAHTNKKGLALTSIRYHGFPPDGTDYWRERVVSTAGNTAKTFRVDLGSGVSVQFALSVYRDGSGTLPHADANTPETMTQAEVVSGNQDATRLADVIIAWNVYQHFYPYFDSIRIDWKSELDEALQDAEAAPDAIAFRDVLRRLVAKTGDGHGQVVLSSPPLYQLPFDWDWIENHLVITAVLGPDVGGIVRGDIVEAIDGAEVAKALVGEESLIAASTPQLKLKKMLYALAARYDDQPVMLKARHANGEDSDVEIVPRKNLFFEEAMTCRPLQELEPGIWYVNLSGSNEKDWENAMANLAKAKGIVVDLRNYVRQNGAVLLSHMIDHPVLSQQYSYHVVAKPDRHDVARDVLQTVLYPQPPHFGGKLAFLADGWTVSYNETLLSYAATAKLGAIVGGPSAGINGHIGSVSLPGGYQIAFTGTEVLNPDGSKFFGLGIKPDIPAAQTIAGVRDGRDEMLEMGDKAVGGQARPGLCRHND